MILARKDFQTRYKRASLGIAWAVVVPLIQAAAMAVVFSRVIKTGGGHGYPIYVLSGIVPFTYFSMVISAGVTSLVDGSNVTDKVWFPRLVLALVPVISSLVGYLIALVSIVALMPVLGVGYSVRMLMLGPASLLLVALSTVVAAGAAALHVYFRDTKFVVQAALTVWVYVTPVVYNLKLLHHLGPLVEANPLTGVVVLFHWATVGGSDPLLVPAGVTCGVTAILALVVAEAYRRHDRLFVDLL